MQVSALSLLRFRVVSARVLQLSILDHGGQIIRRHAFGKVDEIPIIVEFVDGGGGDITLQAGGAMATVSETGCGFGSGVGITLPAR